MVPPRSDRVSRVPPYSISRNGRFRIRGYHPLWRVFPNASANERLALAPKRQVTALPFRLRAAPLSLIATRGISVDFFSSGYLDISVPRVRLAHLWIQCAITNVVLVGFPHSEIPGSKSVSDSPRLIAGSHVLHRLQLPRHPPNALVHLTI